MPVLDKGTLQRKDFLVLKEVATQNISQVFAPNGLTIGVDAATYPSAGLRLPSKIAPVITSNLLYNENGVLKFNGVTLVSGSIPAPSAGGWTDAGSGVYLTTATDTVAIGQASATTTEKLLVKVADSEDIGGVLIDFDETGGEFALNVQSEASTWGINVGAQYGMRIIQSSGGQGLQVKRNIAEAGSSPLAYFLDDNTSNAQSTLKVQQDGTGDILNLFDGAAEVFTVLDGGNVGIGAASPTKGLTVEFTNTNTTVATGHGLSGGALGDGVLIENLSTATNTYANLDFRAASADARIALVYTDANDGDFHFVTDNNNSPKSSMVIKSAGSVGIGTTSPDHLFHMSSDAASQMAQYVHVDGDPSEPEYRFYRSKGTAADKTSTDASTDLGTIAWYAYNADDTAYDIMADVFVEQMAAKATGESGGASMYIRTAEQDGTGVSNVIKLSDDKHVTVPNGYVGIGSTATPDVNLHIQSTGDAAIYLEADTNDSGESDNAWIKFSQDNTILQAILGTCGATDKDPENNTYTGVINNATLLGTLHNYDLQFGTYDNVRMTILRDGKVGIGTTAPRDNLNISATTSGGPSIEFTRSDSTIITNDKLGNIYFGGTEDDDDFGIGAVIRAAAGAAWLVADGSFSSTPAYLEFKTCPVGATSTTTRMTIGSDGDVGIQTTNPGQILDCNSGGGNMIADGYDTHSLTIYKENIELAPKSLSKLINCPPQVWTRKPFISADTIKEAAIEQFGQEAWDVYFSEEASHRNKALYTMPDGEMKTWIDEWCEKQRQDMRPEFKWQQKHVGLVADDSLTLTHMPEVVSYDNNEEPAGINTMSYVGILHSAIVELSTRLEALENS
jgi:hypothetical protein